jgi:hypothetical protein
MARCVDKHTWQETVRCKMYSAGVEVLLQSHLVGRNYPNTSQHWSHSFDAQISAMQWASTAFCLLSHTSNCTAYSN